jgi:hypothetical protein
MAFKIKEITMLMMRDHGVRDYAELPHMDTTDVGVLHDDDRACLDALGQYLAGTDAWQRFGIWLLHKHFEPAAGEVFIEKAVTEPRGTQTAPADRTASGELHTTAIRFDSDDASVVGMEFAAPADFGDTAPLSDDDEAVLAGLAERLAAHGKTDRFGVRLIRNPLALTENELLHESSDSANRTLSCVVGLRDEVLAERTTIQTAWRWTVKEGATAPIVMQDCTAACIRAGEGHDISHKHTEPDVYD